MSIRFLVVMWSVAVASCSLAGPEVLAGQNIVVLLDDSGSMADRMRSDWDTRKIDAARMALLTVLEQVPDDARIGVLSLNGGGADHWILPLAIVNRGRLQSSLQRLHANGGTPLGQYMKVAADALLRTREEFRYGTYSLLIVTDGEAGDQTLVEGYLPDILSRGIVVDVIGVDMQADHSLATQVHTYRRADDPVSLRQAISEVVLGESAADDGDAGDSDFELLKAIPDEVAAEALKALAKQGNTPIAQKVARASRSSSSGRPGGFSPRSGRPPSGDVGNFMQFISGCCGMVCCAGFAIVLMLLFRSTKRRRRMR